MGVTHRIYKFFSLPVGRFKAKIPSCICNWGLIKMWVILFCSFYFVSFGVTINFHQNGLVPLVNNFTFQF